MRTLIIGDLHHQTCIADAILAAEPHEEVIFVGDYFDAHFDSPTNSRKTALWIRAQLEQPHSKLLLGNCDLAYAFDAEEFPFVMSCMARLPTQRSWPRQG